MKAIYPHIIPKYLKLTMNAHCPSPPTELHLFPSISTYYFPIYEDSFTPPYTLGISWLSTPYHSLPPSLYHRDKAVSNFRPSSWPGPCAYVIHSWFPSFFTPPSTNDSVNNCHIPFLRGTKTFHVPQDFHDRLKPCHQLFHSLNRLFTESPFWPGTILGIWDVTDWTDKTPI